ncbi:hypothetical protein [Streptomyces turgidiscabies]|uniref:hypothetical protein n=1 Tax=Streptomyces turgidiscabies TaxID=85558 RepID=UPI0038F80F5D
MAERLTSPNPEEQPKQLTDTERVHEAVELARETNTVIPHEVARVIAAILSKDDSPALFNLAASGEVYLQGLMQELGPILFDPETPEQVSQWIEAMKVYVRERDDFGPQDGWADLWVSDGYTDMDACSVCGAHRDEAHYETCPRGDLERPDQVPGAGGDLMRMLNSGSTTLFDMAERVRIRDAFLDYLSTNYVGADEAADMITQARLNDLSTILDLMTIALSFPETWEVHHSFDAVIGEIKKRVNQIEVMRKHNQE